MVLFENAGRQNTEECVRIAVQKAIELDCEIVAASTLGLTAGILLDTAEELGFKNKIVIVRGCSWKHRNGQNLMPAEKKAELIARGATIVTAEHALSAGERGLSGKLKGYGPLEIMAETLRMFGQGTKVCVETSIMALNADELTFGKPVVAIGGSHRGCDTALVVTPSFSSTILETVIHEILCKPGDINNPDKSMDFDPKLK